MSKDQVSYNSSLDDCNIKKIMPLISPACVKEQVAVTDAARKTVGASRTVIQNILSGQDTRILVICGPCSVHDPDACLEYATRLKDLAVAYGDRLFVVMRVYFEKPRTTVGWKGFVNDPCMNSTFQMNAGLLGARKLLVDINHIGIPTATEFLDTTTPQYYADLVSWGCIGARTVQSQLHRELASGLSMPIGFKNCTTGDIQVAVDAVTAGSHEHTFVGVTQEGTASIIHTKGNPHCHVVLRGGSKTGPQYSADWIQRATELMVGAGVTSPAILIDCSHANSNKDFRQQDHVAQAVIRQLDTKSHKSALKGIMLESHIHEGNQPVSATDKRYGVSVTDGCINLETTGFILQRLYWQLGEKSPLLVAPES